MMSDLIAATFASPESRAIAERHYLDELLGGAVLRTSTTLHSVASREAQNQIPSIEEDLVARTHLRLTPTRTMAEVMTAFETCKKKGLPDAAREECLASALAHGHVFLPNAR